MHSIRVEAVVPALARQGHCRGDIANDLRHAFRRANASQVAETKYNGAEFLAARSRTTPCALLAAGDPYVEALADA